MRHAMILAGLLAFAGCQTYRRPVYSTAELTLDGEPDTSYEDTEEELLEACEDTPDEPMVWIKLGRFYENGARYSDAIEAYTRLKHTTEKKYPGQAFTGPDYDLGKLYAKMGDYQSAVRHLGLVLEHQPESLSDASLNRHFGLSHQLLAAIYYDNRQWDAAEEHALAFLDLGGDEISGERLLMDIRYARDHDVRR